MFQIIHNIIGFRSITSAIINYFWYYICSKTEFNKKEQFVGQANIEVPEIKKRCLEKLDILETEYLSNSQSNQATTAAAKWINKYLN